MAVKISYSPINELVVHEVVKLELDDLLRERITPSGNMPLYWCNGILFAFTSPPLTRDIMRDYLNGKIHWMEVHYTEMKKYDPVLELNDEQYKAILKIRVIDTSKSLLHLEFVKWLNNNR
ncbi:MAG: hypothetical protein ACP5TL_01205 [Candidatus Micrarchaeia archaeon]